MEILNAYFNGLVFFKVEQKENFTVYAASISSSFGDGTKTYALAFVPVHMAILNKGYLKDLHWQNFQTRTLTNGWKMPSQRWDMKQLKGLPTPMFNSIERNEVRTKYLCESEPLEMLLLHDPKKKSIYQYHNRINLLAALATFRCVLNFVEGHEMQATRTVDSVLPHQSASGSKVGGNYHQGPPSSIPISSLASRIPGHTRAEAYRAAGLPEDTSYVPRHEGTLYASNSENAGEGQYDFDNTTIVGNTGYRNLSLNITIPHGGQEEPSRVSRGRTSGPTFETRIPEFQRNSEMQDQIDDSFELL